MQKILIASSMLLALAWAARKASSPEPPGTIQLTIQTHGVQLTEEDAKRVIAKENTFLLQAGSPVSINLKSFTDGGGSGIIKTCTDLNALLANKNANVHIVKEIRCCGDKAESDAIAGCSGKGMSIIALPPVDLSAHPENARITAVQWLHELGHRRGLGHSRKAGALMAPKPGAGNTKIDECELNAFSGNSIPAGCSAFSSGPQQAQSEVVRPAD
jgi:hypothetical protein